MTSTSNGGDDSPPSYDLTLERDRAMQNLRNLKQEDENESWPIYDLKFNELRLVARPSDREALKLYLSGLRTIDICLPCSSGPLEAALSRVQRICAEQHRFGDNCPISTPSEADVQANKERIRIIKEGIDNLPKKVVYYLKGTPDSYSQAECYKAWYSSFCKGKMQDNAEYLSRFDDGCDIDGLKAAYPRLGDKQICALLKLKDVTQTEDLGDLYAYDVRCDALVMEAGTMDRRVIQYYFNGLKDAPDIKFKFVPVDYWPGEDDWHAYERLGQAARYIDTLRREKESRQKSLKWDRPYMITCSSCGQRRVSPAIPECQDDEDEDEERNKAEMLHDINDTCFEEHMRASAYVGFDLSVL